MFFCIDNQRHSSQGGLPIEDSNQYIFVIDSTSHCMHAVSRTWFDSSKQYEFSLSRPSFILSLLAVKQSIPPKCYTNVI